jgi:hypothetical protein
MALLLAGAVNGETLGTAVAVAEMPVSVVQMASGGTMGAYDVSKAFSNPAILGYQPRTWELGLSNQLMFGGEQNYWVVAGGWLSSPNDGSAYGFAGMASGLSMPKVEEIDQFGDYTGGEVAPSSQRYGIAGVYRYQSACLGAGLGYAAESLGGLMNESGKSQQDLGVYLLDIGGTLNAGKWDLGLAYRIANPTDKSNAPVANSMSLGASYSAVNLFNGSINGEVLLPGGGVAGAQYNGGVAWDAHKALSLQAGLCVPTGSNFSAGSGMSARAGLTARFMGLAVNYASNIPFNPGVGVSHLVGINWSSGQEKSRPAGPLTGVKGPRFQADGKSKSIAVANFEPQNVGASDATVVSDLVRNALVNEGIFDVVEKQNMDAILTEQQFQQGGCTSEECAVKMGVIINARYMVMGTFGKVMSEYVVMMRVVDVESAKIVYHDVGQGKNLEEVRTVVNGLVHRLAEAFNSPEK